MIKIAIVRRFLSTLEMIFLDFIKYSKIFIFLFTIEILIFFGKILKVFLRKIKNINKKASLTLIKKIHKKFKNLFQTSKVNTLKAQTYLNLTERVNALNSDK